MRDKPSTRAKPPPSDRRLFDGPGAVVAPPQSPAISQLRHRHPLLWHNPRRKTGAEFPDVSAEPEGTFTFRAVEGCRRRLLDAAPFFERVYPQTRPFGGRFESPLIESAALTARMRDRGLELARPILIKCDQLLAVSGSVDARAAALRLLELLEETDRRSAHRGETTPSAKRAGDAVRRSLAGRRIQVSGRSNHALATALLACPLGCQVDLYTSRLRPWPEWKIERARLAGADIHESENTSREEPGSNEPEAAVTARLCAHATAALELAEQLAAAGIRVDLDHPLLVYLPGSEDIFSAAVAAGLRWALGEHVYCFVGDSVSHPALAAELIGGSGTTLEQIGFDGHTRLEGYRRRACSGAAVEQLASHAAGCYTAIDEDVLAWLFEACRLEGLRLEPAAAVGFAGVTRIAEGARRGRLEELELAHRLPRARHLVWSTSGGLVPRQVFRALKESGRDLAEAYAAG